MENTARGNKKDVHIINGKRRSKTYGAILSVKDYENKKKKRKRKNEETEG